MQRIATKSRYFTCNAGLYTVLTTLQTRNIPCQLLPYVLCICYHGGNVIARKFLEGSVNFVYNGPKRK